MDFDVLATVIAAQFPTKNNAVIASMDVMASSDLGLSLA